MFGSMECYPCLCRIAADAAGMACSDKEIQTAAMREALERLAGRQTNTPVFQLCQEMQAVICQRCGNSDPFKEERRLLNSEAQNMLSALERQRDEAPDRFAAAVLISAAGSVLATAHRSRTLNSAIRRAWRGAMRGKLQHDGSQALAERLAGAKNIFFLADNAGEIVWDRLLIEMMPVERVHLVVKRRPYLIDALVEDAVAAGIPDAVKLVPYSIHLPDFESVTADIDLPALLREADLIITKGAENMAFMISLGLGEKCFCMLVPECFYLAGLANVQQGLLVADFLASLQRKDAPRRSEVCDE